VSGDDQVALELTGVTAGHAEVPVLRNVSLQVRTGSVVALLGSNGAGKTTLLRVVAGFVRQTHGTVTVAGNEVTRLDPAGRARAGVCLIPEGRGVFPSLSVRENLELQMPAGRSDRSIDLALDIFPALGTRLRQVAGTMSGGQQQMLALSRAFLAGPSVILLDEVSMGLAPLMVQEIFEALHRLAATGVAMLLVEQYVAQALEFADQANVLRRGELVYTGPSRDLRGADLLESYLGAGAPS